MCDCGCCLCPIAPLPGKVMTAAELEASLTAGPPQPTPTSSKPSVVAHRPTTTPPAPRSSVLDMLARSKLALNGPRAPSPPSQGHPQPANGLPSVLSSVAAAAAPLPPGVRLMNNPPGVAPGMGKVTTVSELEASFKDVGLGGPRDMAYQQQQGKMGPPPLPQQQQQQAAAEQHKVVQQLQQLQQQQQLQQHLQQQQNKQLPPQAAGGPGQQQAPPPTDMAAFNKLLGLMKASGSLPQTPKMPVSHLRYLCGICQCLKHYE